MENNLFEIYVRLHKVSDARKVYTYLYFRLLHILGVDLQPKIHSPKDVTELLLKFQNMKLRDTTESEEHETRTKRSSEIGSEVKHN